jgi:hypothetical protein
MGVQRQLDVQAPAAHEDPARRLQVDVQGMPPPGRRARLHALVEVSRAIAFDDVHETTPAGVLVWAETSARSMVTAPAILTLPSARG